MDKGDTTEVIDSFIRMLKTPRPRQLDHSKDELLDNLVVIIPRENGMVIPGG